MDENVGHRLKQVRIALGLTQSQMAEILGVKQGTYSPYEKNGSIPSDKLELLKYKKNVNIDWVLFMNGSMFLSESDNPTKGNSANISGNNNNIGAINGNNISIGLPEKGYQKIISSDGSQTTIEAQSFDIARMKQVEAENIELRKKVDTLTQELINAKNELLDVYRKITKN